MKPDIHVLEDPEKIAAYLRDESSAFTGNAERVFLPRSAAEVAWILGQANDAGARVTISGAGTSITGSRVPLSGGWVVSMEQVRHPASERPPVGFEQVHRRDFSFFLDSAGKRAIVPAGVRLSELDEALERFGLLYPPDPTEMSAMIGGTVATNASGARSFRFGPTRAWVNGLRLVLPDGTPCHLARGQAFATQAEGCLAVEGRVWRFPIPASYRMPRTKNAAGLYLAPGMDLVDLFIGAEGLLGVITEVEIALIPRFGHLAATAAFFPTLGASLDFADRLRAGIDGKMPLSIEFFDARSLTFMRTAFPAIPGEAQGAILFEFAYEPAGRHNPFPSAATAMAWRKALEASHALSDWTAIGRDLAEMKKFRHALPEAINAWVRLRMGKLGMDLAVPGERFREIVRAYEDSAATGVAFVLFGHIGDHHLHMNFLPENREQQETARRRYLELARQAAAAGGTISAEHGVGKKTITDESGNRVPYLALMTGEEGLRTIAGVKHAFDPDGRLNPGNMIPEGYQA